MSLTIRTFTESDRNAVVRLWTECGLVYPQNDPHRDIDRKTAHGLEFFLVAILDRSIVGSVMGGYEGHRGWVNYLAVAPEHRRSGIARELMSELERRLRRIGCAKINLQIRSNNPSVMEFYRRIGFAQDEVICMGRRLIDDRRDGRPDDRLESSGDASASAPRQ